MIRTVKGGVKDLYALWRHSLLIPHLGDFLGRALLNGNVLALFKVHVNGGRGSQHIKGHAIVFSQNGHAGRTDFVARIAVGRNAVTAHKHRVYPPVFHHLRGHVVANEGRIHPIGHHLKGGQACALQQRPGFIAEHLKIHAPFPAQMNGSQRRAVPGGGQLPGVAVGQNAVPVLEQSQTVFANLAAHPHILVLNGHAFPAQQLYQLGQRRVFMVQHHLLHPVQRPGQIDGRRPGGVQIFLGLVKLHAKILIIPGLNALCRQIHAKGRRHADSGRAAHLQQINRIPDFLLPGQFQHFHPARQPGLVNNHQRAFFIVQRNRFVAHNGLFRHVHPLLFLTDFFARYKQKAV